MTSPVAEEIYERYVRELPARERLRLLAIVAQDLAPQALESRITRSVMELHGLGAERWKGIDPDAYVERLRAEWDAREVLVHPIQQGEQALSNDYVDLLLHGAHFQTIPIDALAAQRAAELRGRSPRLPRERKIRPSSSP